MKKLLTFLLLTIGSALIGMDWDNTQNPTFNPPPAPRKTNRTPINVTPANRARAKLALNSYFNSDRYIVDYLMNKLDVPENSDMEQPDTTLTEK